VQAAYICRHSPEHLYREAQASHTLTGTAMRSTTSLLHQAPRGKEANSGNVCVESGTNKEADLSLAVGGEVMPLMPLRALARIT